MTSAAERRQQVLERARHRRRRLAAERDQAELRRALVVGGTIGVAIGVVLGQLLWDNAMAGPSIAAVVGLALGVGAGAGVIYSRELADERAREAEAVRQREAERARRREEVRKTRRSPPPKVATKAVDDDDFLIPPGFYPDPQGGKAARWWDGTEWTAKVRAPTAA
jgi:Protein of unknown function (DUF2510)